MGSLVNSARRVARQLDVSGCSLAVGNYRTEELISMIISLSARYLVLFSIIETAGLLLEV